MSGDAERGFAIRLSREKGAAFPDDRKMNLTPAQAIDLTSKLDISFRRDGIENTKTTGEITCVPQREQHANARRQSKLLTIKV
jgi:hypothetical protein